MQLFSLKLTCFQAVGKHLAALGIKAVLDLPAPLLHDLIPHLTVCQLDELHSDLNRRGISTLSGWVAVLRDIHGPQHAVDLYTEEEAKHEVMKLLFTHVFYGYTNNFLQRNMAGLNTSSFLCAAAKCIRHFVLIPSSHQPLQSLTAEQQQPLLSLLEKHIRSVGISQSIDMLKRTSQAALYVLHRLLDHGMAKEVVLHVQSPVVLAWLLHGRGSQYVNPELENLMNSQKPSRVSQTASASAHRHESCGPSPETGAPENWEDEVIPRKCLKLDSVSVEEESGKANFPVEPQVLCKTFNGPSAEECPRGQICCLDIRHCGSDSLRLLTAALPTFFCLRSLTLHSISTFRDTDVSSLAGALKQLSESSRSSFAHLSISVLPNTGLVAILLDACPRLTSLHVEIQTVMWGRDLPSHRPKTGESELPELVLEKLTIKVLQTDLHFITSVLRRCPHLASLHIAGLRLPTGSSQSRLLATISEVNLRLRSLNLEDVNLSDCLPDILHLLSNCKLEALRLNDCRLLERWRDKEESLKQLVAALKTAPSLRTLGLAQNRLARNAHVLAELFSGPAPSSVKHLDLSSNFIQPTELLQFTQRLGTHRPPHRLTLELRKNPGDRDPDTWNAALDQLRSFCVVVVEGWKSTDTMADYVSNM